MRSRMLPLVLCALLVTGCTQDSGSDGDAPAVALSAPEQRLTVVADADPSAAAGCGRERSHSGKLPATR